MLSHLAQPVPLARLWRAWTRGVFSLDTRALAMMRIALGLIALADVVTRSTDLIAHYTDRGVLPREVAAQLAAPQAWSVLSFSGNPGYAAFIFALAAFAAICFAVGYRTFLSNLACWVLLLSIQNRNVPIFHSGDTLLRLAFFWALFLPMGAQLSADARRAGAGPQTVFSTGSICFTVQILLLFLCLLDHKLLGHAWLAGTAVEQALSVQQYQRPFGAWLHSQHWLLPAMTYAVLLAQLIVPVLLLLPNAKGRIAAIVITVLTQVGFGMSFILGHFPWTTSAVMLGLAPGSVVDRFAGLWRRLEAKPSLYEPWNLSSTLVGKIVGFGCLFLVLVWNLGEAGAVFTFGDHDVSVSDSPIGAAALLLRLDQRWSMFAPNPQTEDGWFALEGQTRGGKKVALMPWLVRGENSPEVRISETPRSISHAIGADKSHRWAMLFLALAADPSPVLVSAVEDYACRQWNARASEASKINRLSLSYLHFDHLPDDRVTATQITPLGSRTCGP